MRVTGDAWRLWSLSLLALLIACGATVARAQQEEQPEDGAAQCTAQLNPTVFDAGAPSIPVEVTLSRDIGAVTDLGAGASGLELAVPDTGAEQPMADEPGENPAQGGEMVDPQNLQTVWFDTENAVVGTHEIVLVGESGECTALVTVAGEGVEPVDGDAREMERKDGGADPYRAS